MNKVVKNASWIIGCKIAQSILNLIIGVISARYLGPSNYGLITYAASVVAFVIPIMQLGLSKTIVQELIEQPDREGEVLGTALGLNLISAAGCMLGVFGFLKLSNPDDPLTVLVGVLYSISLIFQATEILQYWFQAKLLSKYTSIASLAAYVFAAAYKIYLLVSQKPIAWFAVYNSVEYLLISVILVVIYLKLGSQRLMFSADLVRSMLHRSKHYIISAMMVTIFLQTDRIMLKHMISDAETGYYSAALACIGMTGFVFGAIIDSMRPVILESKKRDEKAFQDHLIRLYCIITYLAFLQSIVMTLFAKPIVWLLYGSAYMESVAPMRIAVWYITFSYYGSIRNIWILAEEKQKYLWMINLSGAIANGVINICLIPALGSVGAAIASLISQLFTNVVVGYLIPAIRFNNTLLMKGLHPGPLIEYAKHCVKRTRRK